MPQTYSAASIYAIIDRMDATAIQQWLDFHKRLKYPPRFVNVFTAARFNEAPNLLRQIKDSLPLTTPVWRGYDGKDAWGNTPAPEMAWDDSNYYMRLWNTAMTSAKMAAGLWFTRRVKPYVDVIRETGAIIHLLNEAAPLSNAAFETECIRLLGEEGIRAGAFAWAAGTPANWADYNTPPITDAVAMAAKYNALVMCHEYAGLRQVEQNSLINRNATLTKLFPKQPDVFLGEFAAAKATIKVIDGKAVILLDPDVGWREMGATVQQYFGFIGDTAKMWYLPNKISFSLYSGPDWGKNGSFGVMQSPELLDLLVNASPWMCFEVEENPMATAPAPVIMVRPPEAQIGIRVRVKSIPVEYRNLRDTWSYLGTATGQLRPGDPVRRFDIPLRNGPVSAMSTGNWIFVEKLSDDTVNALVVESGYVWSNRVVWEPLGSSTQESPVVVPPQIPPPQPSPIVTGEGDNPPVVGIDPTPAPPAAPVTCRLSYSLEIDATPEMHKIIEKAMMNILVSLAVLGQALGGSEVSIKTDPVAST